MRNLTSLLLVGGMVVQSAVTTLAATFSFQFGGCEGDTIFVQPILGGTPDSIRWHSRGSNIGGDFVPPFDTFYVWNGLGSGRDSIVMHAWYSPLSVLSDSIRGFPVLVDYMVAMGDGITCFENDSILVDVLANDTTSSPSSTEVGAPVLGNVPDHGAVRLEGSRVWYTPSPGYEGTDDFVYWAENSCGDMDSAVVAITVLAEESKLIDSITYWWISVPNVDTILVGDSVRVTAFIRPDVIGTLVDGYPKVYLPGLGEYPGQMLQDTSETLGMVDSTLFSYPGRIIDSASTWLEVGPGNLDVGAGVYPIVVEAKSSVGPALIFRDTIYLQQAIFTRVALPEIVDVSDVPSDQGGFVNIRWRRSPLDMPGSTDVSEYTVWRATPWNSGSLGAKGPKTIGLSEIPRKPGSRVVSTALGAFAWEEVGSVVPHHFEYYAFTAATLYDSTAIMDGMHYFLVSAHSNDGVTFWDSAPDSGYSVDNLAPPAPLLLAVSSSWSGASISWTASSAPDVQNYVVYRDTIPGVMASPALLIATPEDTIFVDLSVSQGDVRYYRVSGVDFSGNEGALSNELSTNACGCTCHGDYPCDGVVDIFDVVGAIEVAFRNHVAVPDPSPSCPDFPIDVNCDNVIDIFDVVKVVNVAFRNANPATEYCEPCSP